MARLKRERLDSAPFPRLIARSLRVEGSFKGIIDLCVMKWANAC